MTLPFSPLLNLLLAIEQGCPSSQRAQWYLTQPWCSCGLFCLPPCNSAVQCGWPPTRITATFPWDVVGGYWGGAWQQGGGCTSSGTSRIDHIGAVITVQLWSHCLLKIKCFSNTKGGTMTLTCDQIIQDWKVSCDGHSDEFSVSQHKTMATSS